MEPPIYKHQKGHLGVTEDPVGTPSVKKCLKIGETYKLSQNMRNVKSEYFCHFWRVGVIIEPQGTCCSRQEGLGHVHACHHHHQQHFESSKSSSHRLFLDTEDYEFDCAQMLPAEWGALK